MVNPRVQVGYGCLKIGLFNSSEMVFKINLKYCIATECCSMKKKFPIMLTPSQRGVSGAERDRPLLIYKNSQKKEGYKYCDNLKVPLTRKQKVFFKPCYQPVTQAVETA